MREGKVGIEDSKSFLPPFLLQWVVSVESICGRETLLLFGDKALMLVTGEWIKFSISSALSSAIVSILEWDIKPMSCFLKDWLLYKEAPWRCCWDCWEGSMLLDEIGSWANGCLNKKQRLIEEPRSWGAFLIGFLTLMALVLKVEVVLLFRFCQMFHFLDLVLYPYQQMKTLQILCKLYSCQIKRPSNLTWDIHIENYEKDGIETLTICSAKCILTSFTSTINGTANSALYEHQRDKYIRILHRYVGVFNPDFPPV